MAPPESVAKHPLQVGRVPHQAGAVADVAEDDRGQLRDRRGGVLSVSALAHVSELDRVRIDFDVHRAAPFGTAGTAGRSVRTRGQLDVGAVLLGVVRESDEGGDVFRA